MGLTCCPSSRNVYRNISLRNSVTSSSYSSPHVNCSSNVKWLCKLSSWTRHLTYCKFPSDLWALSAPVYSHNFSDLARSPMNFLLAQLNSGWPTREETKGEILIWLYIQKRTEELGLKSTANKVPIYGRTHTHKHNHTCARHSYQKSYC